jgi:hypothetical protein
VDKPVPLDDVIDEARRVLSAARAAGVEVRVAGGIAIRLVCPSAQTPSLRREYGDIDLAIAGSSKRRRVAALMLSLGYQADEMLNALNEGSRLRFDDAAHARHVDVFVDAIRMCHVIEFKNRLALQADTLTPTDLLLTKLQIVELNRKDVLDAIALLQDHDFDVAYLEAVWGNDWPLWKTSGLTLGKIGDAVPSVLNGGARARAHSSIERLRQILYSGRKTLRWKVRAQVGERIRWYELPEDAG